jgi:hypothetical protein
MTTENVSIFDGNTFVVTDRRGDVERWRRGAPKLVSSWRSIERTYERSIEDLAALRFYPYLHCLGPAPVPVSRGSSCSIFRADGVGRKVLVRRSAVKCWVAAQEIPIEHKLNSPSPHWPAI